MAEIISNQFASTVSRTTTSTTQEILSNQFTTTINNFAIAIGQNKLHIVNCHS